ncbi:hypothetical protein BDV18DRAFT_89618 [Aspergillus unguis]
MPLRQSLRRPTKSQPPKPAAYWDNLSTIWLTKGALQELQRRIETQQTQPPLPVGGACSEGATSLLQQYSRRRRKEIERFSRQGGPDLLDIRGCPPPITGSSSEHSAPSSAAMPSNTPGTKSSRQTNQKPSLLLSRSHIDTSTTTTTPYSQNFEQNLIDHRIYPPLYQDQDTSDDENEPNNIDEIRRRLAAPRRSLDPATFPKAEFRKFKKAHWAAKKGADVATSVFPFIEGKSTSRQQYASRDTRLTNLGPLTDGTISQAQPDITYGSCPEHLDREIRNQLYEQIVPSADDSLPVAPNFFVEVKGPCGVPRVADRQACYHGALGARAMDTLRSYQPVRGQQGSQEQHGSEPEPRNNNAYTVTVTYQGGSLNLYTSHSAMPKAISREISQCGAEYFMTPLRSFAVVSDVESYCAGAAAYRNARDWAGEVRDEAIARANERLAKARARCEESSLNSAVENEGAA